MEYLVEFPKLNLEFNINPVALTIGNFSIQWYGVIIGLGMLLAMIYSFASAKKMNIDEDKLIDCIILGLIGGVVGARLYYIIFHPGEYLNEATFKDNFLKLINIHSGGLGIYGGLIGALLVGGITAKARKMNVASLFDQVALGFLIGQGIGRWGNFTNQEAFGSPTELPWGMASVNTGGVPVHPCFLYESIFCLLGFLLLHIFTRKFRRYDGQTFLLYIVWYGTVRFFIEPLRTDSLMIGSLKVSVLVSALCVLFGVIALIVFRKRTSLTGCGNEAIMEANGVVFGSVQREREAEKIRKEVSAESIVLKDDETEKVDSKDEVEEFVTDAADAAEETTELVDEESSESKKAEGEESQADKRSKPE